MPPRSKQQAPRDKRDARLDEELSKAPYARLETPLVLGENYREMAVDETGGEYRFQLLKDVRIVYDKAVFPDSREVLFLDPKGNEWMRMGQFFKIIKKGYAWNGCSPKKGVRILWKDFWFGTPDFVDTRAASLNHDTDYQFHYAAHYPFSMEVTNYHFYQILEAHGFKLAKGYYQALKDFSQSAWDGQSTEVVSTLH